MPIRRLLPRWPDARESVDRELLCPQIRRRKVWYPKGPALEVFEQKVQPEISAILSALDIPSHIDVFIRLYMIGRNADEANPIVMICCTEEKVRNASEDLVRENGLLGRHKGFGLGTAALPFEHNTPIRRLAGVDEGGNLNMAEAHAILDDYQHISSMSLPVIPAPTDSQNLSGGVPGTAVFAGSPAPYLGRRICASSTDNPNSFHDATGGVVIEIGGKYYQLTVGHLVDSHGHESTVNTPIMSLNDYHFDGQDSADEDGSSDEDITSEYSVTTRGSSSPPFDEFSGDDMDEQTTIQFEFLDPYVHNGEDQEASSDTQPTLEMHNSLGGKISHDLESIGPCRKTTCLIGFLPHKDKKLPQNLLDYAIIPLLNEDVNDLGGMLNNCIDPSKNLAEVRNQVPKVFAATSAQQMFPCKIIPGTLMYHRSGNAPFQKLFCVDLSRKVSGGQCGSAILDKDSGALFGHLVMGVPGTRRAYFLSAAQIFRDLESRTGCFVSIAAPKGRASAGNSSNLGAPLKGRALIGNPSRRYGGSSRESGSRRSSVFSYGTDCTQTTHAPEYSAISVVTVFDQAIPNRLPCEFVGYAACDETFALDDVDSWVEHIKVEHLRDSLPTKLLCWFCDFTFDYRNAGGDRNLNFHQRMEHIRDHIATEDLTVRHMRPDHHMNNHLQALGLISDESYGFVARWSEVPQGPNIFPHNAQIPDVLDNRYHQRAVVESDDSRRRRRHRHVPWGPNPSTFPSTWRALIAGLEKNHPRKDECIAFVAFGLHEILFVRFENGNSLMLLPDAPSLRNRISPDLIREVEERLATGWTFGDRNTLCAFDTNRWFLEWKRGIVAEFRYNLGSGERDRQDLERVNRVLSGVGSDAAAVATLTAANL
ncbi:hypothetical protein F5Y16DRAFT_397678 [Xylariaceae sp. FL0255]|nr:hypothetical protein F5Y16DRAFT_397678 [Xylariaceae sp. FL0255]